jgi:hypothetical protein
MADQLFRERGTHETVLQTIAVRLCVTWHRRRASLRADQTGAAMAQHPVIRLVSPTPTNKDRPLVDLLKRLGPGRLARSVLNTPAKLDTDPYILLLLADQEFADGREVQARHLVDAAYEFFDRKAKANPPTQYLAG